MNHTIIKWRRIAAAAALTFLLGAGVALAQATLPGQADVTPANIATEIIIPGSKVELSVQGVFKGKIRDLADYMGIVYSFLISIVGLIAAVMMMVGGLQYLTAGGDKSKVDAGKSRIRNAMVGMILALSSYAILNTINPKLVNFSVPDVSSVKTELAVLPWCEDLIASGVAVTQWSGDLTCGSVGQFARGNTAAGFDLEGTPTGQLCIYYGDCKLVYTKFSSSSTYWATCMQVTGLERKKVGEQMKADNNTHFGRCLHCADITASVARTIGYGLLDDACRQWHTTLTNFRNVEVPEKPEDKFRFWSYCAVASGRPSCVQADIDCHSVENNDDDGPFSSSCDENDNDCGCEGYDEDPSVAYSISETRAIVSEDPEDYPTHLGAICTLNPCKNYSNPSKGGAQHFLNGCKGPGISTLIPYYRATTADCRPK